MDRGCRELVAKLDWARTPLGSIENWSPALAATVENLLHTRQAMLLFWGPELIQVYNDSFVPSFGQGKHPAAMGQRAAECWADAWPVVGAQIEAVMSRGEPVRFDDALVPIFRNGRMEEVYWTYSYSPAYDSGAITGTLVIVTETTASVLLARRLEALASLGVALAPATTRGEVHAALVQLADRYPNDLPFLIANELACNITPELAVTVMATAALTRELSELDVVIPITSSVWPEPITRAAGCTLGDQHLVFGLSPRLPFDDSYRSYLVQLVEQIASAFSRIDTADERKRILVQLEAASRAKDEFLAMLGHELRNPLAPIVTALELMRQKETGASQERAIIERQVRHVIRLVDDLLDISKITRGLITLETRIVELADVVSAAVEASAHLVGQRRHQLSVDVARGLRVTGDEARLTQIVLNLLSNAARYTPNGGTILVTAEREKDNAVLSVRDTGAGIEPALLPKVFDLFVQGARSADRNEGGLGLGLAIVKNLVELHRGSVTAESDGPGAGSTFRIRIPLANAERARERASQRRVVAAADSRRVLVVDDNEDAANLLGEIARMRGHDVMIAHDAQTALDAIGTFQPQVAVLDIGLPVMDGYELATHVRTLYPDCRLIALTGYGQDKDRDRSLSAGFTAHLVKPVKVDTLLALLS